MPTIRIDKNIMLPTRDGVRLATDAYRLENAAPALVLVTRTPYDKEQTVVGGGGAAFDIFRAEVLEQREAIAMSWAETSMHW